MALRNTTIMKHDYVGPKKLPVAVIVTYRSRKVASGLPYSFKTVVFAGAADCTIVDWKNETDALNGHAQILGRVKRGEPIVSMAN